MSTTIRIKSLYLRVSSDFRLGEKSSSESVRGRFVWLVFNSNSLSVSLISIVFDLLQTNVYFIQKTKQNKTKQKL
jgi:hypothetical protein